MGLRFSSNIQSHESVNWLTLAAPTGFLVLYRIVRIAQDHPTGRYYISLRSLTTELKEPHQRCTANTNRWKCVSDRRAGRTLRVLLAYATAGGPARQVLTGVRGDPVRRPDVPRARRHHGHGGGNR